MMASKQEENNMSLRSIDPDGPSQLATHISDNVPQDVIVQQNAYDRIRITFEHNTSGKSVWVQETEEDILFILNGNNIERYYDHARNVLGRDHDSDYSGDNREDRTWEDMDCDQIAEIVNTIYESQYE